VRRFAAVRFGSKISGPEMGFKYRILVVDDEPLIRQTSAMVLTDGGYEVRTAGDGFEALIEMRQALPHLIISDLSMPNMSGFEFLSVVRRRFPHIPVIAVTGRFNGSQPGVLIADAYFDKGHHTPEELFESVSRLIKQGPTRMENAKPDTAPVWIPRSSSGYVVVTCTECLRSFSIPDEKLMEGISAEVREVPCEFCEATVRFLTDQPLANRTSGHG
jgi:CheY-like chemotaxis protein